MEKPAILGGKPTKTNPFPNWPQYDQNEEKALMEVLHSGVWWRTPGTKTLQFEQDFAKYHQVELWRRLHQRHGRDRNRHVALGIGPGDEVIVPDFTFVATASAVLTTEPCPSWSMLTRNIQHRSRPCRKSHHPAHQGDHCRSYWRHALRYGSLARDRKET